GDGFDDIADADVIYFNNHTAGTFAWDRFELTNDNIVYEGPARGAGDLDHDGTVDLVLTSVGEGIVTTCLNDGHYPPGFACFTSNTGLPSIGSLVLGDFNGDLTLDVAALGDVPEVAGGENELRLVYGAAYSLPTGNAVALTPYHATAVGIAGSAGRPEFAHYAPQPANELWVALDTGGGAIGLGRGRPVEGSPPAFGLPVPTFDVDFAAARPELRLLRCDDDPPGSGNYVDCSIQSYDGGSPGVAFAQPARATLDRKFPMGTDAYSTNIKFLPEPDDADAVAWVESGGVVLAHPDAASHAYKSALAAPDEGTLDGATFYATEDADGAADPNGDGRAELLVQTIANGACRVLLGRFAPGAPAPASLRTVATVESCVAGKGLDNTDALGTGAPFFLLAPSTDALTLPRQLIATVSTADGRSHLAALAPAADGTFPTPPVLDPARFRPSPGASPAPLPDPAGHRWLATVDMNGDGIPDLLFRTPLGLVAAYADVDRL
ncbi:MAG TPA: hypothetical protein VE987_15105, partial [Polyangiaceae bacterium]|nr:hypothetical protein [Polyangiaceae bacterium]